MIINEDIRNYLLTLNNGELIPYPTDTVWGIGCDATNPEAINKVFALKQRRQAKKMICLVSDLKMMEKYVHQVPETTHKIIELSTKPTTIIYDQLHNLTQNLVAEDDALTIHEASNEFCQKLIRQFRHPIVYTSTNIGNNPSLQSFSEISHQILMDVGYVVNLHRDKKAQPRAVS